MIQIPRIHGSEIADHPRAAVFQRLITESLSHAMTTVGVYDCAGGILGRVLSRSGHSDVVDLCSGVAGGPWPRLYRQLRDNWKLRPHPQRPAEALAILRDNVRSGEAICIFEFTERRVSQLLAIPFLLPLSWISCQRTSLGGLVTVTYLAAYPKARTQHVLNARASPLSGESVSRLPSSTTSPSSNGSNSTGFLVLRFSETPTSRSS